MNSMKRQKDRTMKDKLPRSVGVQYAMEISGEITSERIKGWSQTKNITQLQMGLKKGAGQRIQTFCKERYTNGQLAHKQVLIPKSHQRNAN